MNAGAATREKKEEKDSASIDTHLTQTPSSSTHSSHSNSKQSGHAATATAMKIRETHRVVFMGSGGVGKTSLITQFMEGMFISTYKPTVEDYHRHNIKTPGKQVNTSRVLVSPPLDDHEHHQRPKRSNINHCCNLHFICRWTNSHSGNCGYFRYTCVSCHERTQY